MKIIGQVKIDPKASAKIRKKTGTIKLLGKELKKSLEQETTKIIEICLIGAINLNASDIHIEPKKETVNLRLRTDGVLHDVFSFDHKKYKSLLSRIKLLSAVKLNITDKAQDGRFSILLENTSIEVRVSILPSEYGESVVMRILDPKSLIEIEKLGIRKDMMEMFQREIKQPNGMIIVTGPTGSGKTTTLYAVLKSCRTQR